MANLVNWKLSTRVIEVRLSSGRVIESCPTLCWPSFAGGKCSAQTQCQTGNVSAVTMTLQLTEKG